MKDKYLIFSDLHIHNHSQDWRRVNDAIEVLDWIHKTAIERGIAKIIFGGDFFHIRGYIYPKVISETYRKLLEFKESGLEMYLLVGNHDMPYRFSTKHNSLTVFNSIFTVIEQPMVLEGENWNFYFLPYVENTEHLSWAVDKIIEEKDDTKKSALVAHLDIYNAIYHGTTRSTKGIHSAKLSENFDYTFAGHYHKYQKVTNNVFYVGSPYQINFGEAGQEKGIFIFDDGNIEFIRNDFSPEFIYITPDEIDERITDNYVQISISKINNIPELRKKVQSFEPRKYSFVIKENGDNIAKKIENISIKSRDIKALFKEWVDKNANDELYDKEKLIQTGIKILENTNYEI